MKISYVTMQFPAPSETFASNDVKTLKSLGIDIDVYAMKSKHKDQNNMCKDRGLDGISIYNTGIAEALRGLLEILYSPLLFVSLFLWLLKSEYNKPKHLIKCIVLLPACMYIYSKLQERQPDIVHLFWGHYPSLVGYLVKKKMPNTKLSIFLGAYDLEYALGVSKSLSKCADFIFTHAKVNLEQLQELEINMQRLYVIYRGVDLKRFQYITKKDFQNKSNSWIAAGRLIPLKNFETIIDVFATYNKKCNDAKLSICGDGILRNNLEELVQSRHLADNILFKGHVPQKKLLEYMSYADVMILLSKTERLPNVVKEAMLSGCICVASETPGIDELIEHGVTGFIVSKHKYFEIPEILLNMSEKEKEQMRYKAREFIINYFDVEISMKKYLEIWKTKG